MEARPGRSSSVWIEFGAVAIALLLIMGCAHTPEPATGSKIPRITKEELKSMLGNSDLVILDVRTAQDWKETKWKIKGAVREERGGKDNEWMNKYPKDKTFVLYCA